MSFIDAGAGTGKTRELVEQNVRLVTNGECTIDHIAAITFTEKAAAELRERVREALAKAAEGDNGDDPPTPGSVGAQRAGTALLHFHEAPISTLHAFAQRILVDNLAAAGLPETFDIVDDLAQAARFERRWAATSKELLTDTGLLREALERSAGLGVDLLAWRTIAQELDGEWDRCQQWLAGVEKAERLSPIRVDRVIDAFESVLADARTLKAEMSTPRLFKNGKARALKDEDTLVTKIELEIPTRIELLPAVDPTDGFALCHGLAACVMSQSLIGSKDDWSDVESARSRFHSARAVLGEVANEAFLPLLAFVAKAAVESADQRRASGSIMFHDVLVLARNLVRDVSEARLRCRQQLRHLFIDESQDTDPLQAEIALALSFAGDAVIGEAGAAVPLPPPPFALEPNRLVFVGDPKQSIYRFRRADVAEYSKMKGRFEGSVKPLNKNFRSRLAIVEWTNDVFAAVFGEPASPAGTEVIADMPGHQVAFQSLKAVRAEPIPELAGPCTMAFGKALDPKEGKDLKAVEADDVAAVVAAAVGNWEIVDKETTERRFARPSDVAVLLRTRSLLPALASALMALDIPFRFEGRGLAWASQEIADVVVVLAAIDDPADQAKILAALRSRSIGASDDELLAWKQAGGTFTLRPSATGRVEQEDDAPKPVTGSLPEGSIYRGLVWLRSLPVKQH